MAKNNAANVSTGRGVKGGYFYSAPRTAAILEDFNSLLDLSTDLETWEHAADFKNIGYVTADGFNETESADTSTDTDMNGDPINTSRSNRTEQVAVTVAELKKDTLSEIHGHSNVTDADGTLMAHHNNDEREHRIYVAELVLKGGRRMRKIIPDGQINTVGDLTINSTTLMARQLTIDCNTYTYTYDGTTWADTVVDVYESTETQPANP